MFDETDIPEEIYRYEPPAVALDLYTHLKSRIYGQDAAIKRAAIIAASHERGHKQSALFVGPTGCGKTEIWRALQDYVCDINIIDGTQITASNYKGDLHLRDIFLQTRSKAEAEHLLLVIDEADKLFEPEVNTDGTDYSMILQNNFLKILDGDTLKFNIPSDRAHRVVEINCRRVSVVFLGAFERLMDKLQADTTKQQKSIGFGANLSTQTITHHDVTINDLIRFGNIRREIVGRLQSVTVLDAVNAQGYRHILDAPDMSPIKKLEREYHCNIIVDETLKDTLCENAYEQGLGVRYINNQLRLLVEDSLFENPAQNTLILTM